MISYAWNHAEPFPQHLEELWKSRKLSQNWKIRIRSKIWMMPIQYRCLCLQLVKLRWNELFCSWEIANRHLFFGGEFKVKFCENFSRKRKLRFSLLSDAYNCNIDAYIKWNTVFSSWKSWIGILKDNNFFSVAPVAKFWRRFCENQGRFVLVSLG